MNSMNAKLKAIAMAGLSAAAAFTMSACGPSRTVSGTATTPPTIVTGSTASASNPSTVKTLTVDELARDSVQHAVAYWDGEGIPLSVAVRMTDGNTACPNGDTGTGSGLYCGTDGSTSVVISFSTPKLESIRTHGGDLAVKITAAHEVGHAVAAESGFDSELASKGRTERVADCFAGAYLHQSGVSQSDAKAAYQATNLVKYDSDAAALKAGYSAGDAITECVDVR